MNHFFKSCWGLRSGRCFGAIFCLLMAVGPVAAQPASHTYLPLNHWSMPFLEHLVRRGVIPDPSPMLRPWRMSDVAKALGAVRTNRATRAEKDMIERLKPLFTPPTDSVSLWIEADAGARASTHARINSELRAAGDGRVFEQIGVNSGLQFGSIGLVMHPLWDPNFNHDPDYGGRAVPIKIRYEETYATVRTKYLAVDFGRLRRNWGPVGLPSLIVSSNPYAYDHLYIQAGPDRVSLQMLITQLDDMIDSDGLVSKRFWAAHRITARITNGLDLAVWESSIISHPGQTLEFWFVNPLAIQFQGEDEQVASTNSVIGGDGELRLPSGLRLSGSVNIDDIQLVNSGSKSNEPPSYAITGICDWAYRSITLSLAYTQVSNLSYRTNDPSEAYLIDQNLDRGHPGVGLARNFTDYDQTTLKAGILASAGVLLTPEVTLLRQGEGDLRLPFPTKEELGSTATIFSGVVEKTLRIALTGDYEHPSGVHLAFSAGWHHVTDVNHVRGATDDKFVGTLQLRYVLDRSWPLKAVGIQ